MSSIVVNLRNVHAPLTGVQRYTRELVSRLRIDAIDPGPRPGLRGHFWEQIVLPRRLHGRLLWSPGNTGPLSVERQVVTIHDVSTLDRPEAHTGAFAAWYRFLLPRLARRVRRVLTVSEFSRSRIIERTGVSPDRVCVVYNGVDHARFRPRDESEIKRVRTTLRIPSQTYVLCVLSSLAAHRNPAGLLAAWRLAQRELRDDVWLVLAGGPSRPDIFARAALPELPPRTTQTGSVESDDLPALYSGANAFVYPSTYDSFGLPMVEALACGAPAIVSNAAALPEIAGDAALYVNPGHTGDIADAIVRLLGDPSLQADLRRRGLRRAACFNWDETARRTLEILNAAAAS
jgi:glycosyltransferase involved in cell wall biosynthesis